MSDLFILYCGFMYLFSLGNVLAGFCVGTPIKGKEITGALFNLLLAPIVTPIMLGWIYYSKN